MTHYDVNYIYFWAWLYILIKIVVIVFSVVYGFFKILFSDYSLFNHSVSNRFSLKRRHSGFRAKFVDALDFVIVHEFSEITQKLDSASEFLQ